MPLETYVPYSWTLLNLAGFLWSWTLWWRVDSSCVPGWPFTDVWDSSVTPIMLSGSVSCTRNYSGSPNSYPRVSLPQRGMLLRLIAFCFFFGVLYYLPQKICCMRHFGIAASRGGGDKWLQFCLSCTEQSTLCSYSSSLLRHTASDKQTIFFFAQEGSHHQYVLQQKSLCIKEMIRSLFQSQVCLWHCR